MYFTIINYLFSNTQSSYNAQAFLVAFAAVTILTQNVSSEISNHIEEVPKDASRQPSAEAAMVTHKELEKSTTMISDISKSNDTEKSRRSRYLRTMPIPMRPSSSPISHRPLERSSSAAAAAAAAADEDLRLFGKISKYHAVPYNGRKKFAGVSMGLPSRHIHGSHTRYRYVNDDGRGPGPVSNKWRLFPSHYASTLDESASPYDSDGYYENGQTITMLDDEDHNHDQEDTEDWPYREISKKERDVPIAFEDAEPALSLKHVVGKRGPFNQNNFQLYSQNTIAHGGAVIGDVDLVDVAGGGGGDRRYKKYTHNRGRDEENSEFSGEWTSSSGSNGRKRTSAIAALKRDRLRGRGGGGGDRLKSTFSSHKSQLPKHTSFEVHDSRHRFKFDNLARNPMKSVREINGGGGGYRKRYRDRGRYSPSMALATFNRDELPAKGYEPTSGDANEHENQVSTLTARRPSQQFVQDDGGGEGDSDDENDSYEDNDNDSVVYSSRYRNKQEQALAIDHLPDTSQHVVDIGDVDSEAEADESDPSRLFLSYRQRPIAARLSKKSKLVRSNSANRKSTSNNISNVKNNHELLPFDSSVDETSQVDENRSPKFNYKYSKPITTSTPSSFFFSSPAASSSSSSSSSSSFSNSVHSKRTPSSSSSNHRPSSLSPAITSTNFNTSNSNLLDFEYDFNSLKTQGNSFGAEDVNAISQFENENKATENFKSDGGISTSELIAYMSASPSEQVVNKQDRFSKPSSMLGLAYPFVRTFSEQRDQLESNFYQPAAFGIPAAFSDQDFEINID